MVTLVPPPTRTVSRLAATCLALESLLVLFGVLAAIGLLDVPDAAVWTAGGVLAGACLLGAGLVRTRAGLWFGTGLQVVLVATGFWVPAMFFLGAVFAGLWVWFLWLGHRVDTEAAARDAAPPVDR